MSERVKLTSAMEDYLKAILELGAREVSTQALANALGISPASATRMVQKLADLKFLDYERYRGVSLTETGRREALETLRHHRLIETYLAQALGLSWDEVHEEAERLEHVLSERLEARIADALGHPTFDPHGDPIPRLDGSLPERPGGPLSELDIGQTVRVVRILNQDPEVLRYLGRCGLQPGTALQVLERAPFRGPLTLLSGDEQLVLGFELAAALQVEPLPAVDRQVVHS